MNKELVFFSQSRHLQLNTPYVYRQRIRVLKLLDVLKSYELGLESKQYHHIKSFFTGKVFPQETSQQVVYCEKNGDKIYDEMIKERLQPDCTVGIVAPIKKL